MGISEDSLHLEENSSKIPKVVINEVLSEIVTEAFMAGQADAGVDPSYSSAQAYYTGRYKVGGIR